MPRGSVKKSKRANNARRVNSTRRRSRPSSRVAQIKTSVHRRIVLFPNVPQANWLSTLSWFASISLKVFRAIVGVRDDLYADSHITGSGSTIILGPGDFAAMSPMASPVTTTRPDKEVKALRSFPFERAALTQVQVKIVPSADLGTRGGMYAAVIVPIDSIDSTISDVHDPSVVRTRYSCMYDDIIKNPRARLAMVTSPITLSLRLGCQFHNIRTIWNDTTGYVNTFPSCALSVAFSDMASTSEALESNYSPTKSLFEVHLRGNLHLAEPSELTLAHDAGDASMSCYTPNILTTESKSINYQFYDKRYEMEGEMDLRKIPLTDAKEMLQHYNRLDLLPKLESYHAPSPSAGFEHLQIDDVQ